MILPKISIVTPCFNAEKYIEETIISIINQGYENLEYIIIDGGSTDGTVDIIKKYQDKISYWISEPDKGQSHAINKGIAVATGEVFNWINADDYLETGALSIVGEFFGNPSIDVLCTATILFNKKGNIRINGNTIWNKTVSLFQLLNSTGLNQQGMYWRLERIRDLNGVNTAFNYSMDLDLWKRYLLTFGNSKIETDERITGYFRLSDESKTGSNFESNFHLFEQENHAALRHYAKFIGSKALKAVDFLYPGFDPILASKHSISDLPEDSIKKWFNNLFFTNAKEYYYQENFKAAFYLLRCIDVKFLEQEEVKNYNSYKRWSRIKRFF
jgi:glycosyltransferase involved in cell wall biosynthesis